MESIARLISVSKVVVVQDLPVPAALVTGRGVTGSKPIALVRPGATFAQFLALGGA